MLTCSMTRFTTGSVCLCVFYSPVVVLGSVCDVVVVPYVVGAVVAVTVMHCCLCCMCVCCETVSVRG